MLNLLASAAARWEDIGGGLKVAPGAIESLQQSNKRPINKLSEILQIWMDTWCSPVTWENIIEVVEGPIVDKKNEAKAMRDFLGKDENFEHYKNQ